MIFLIGRRGAPGVIRNDKKGRGNDTRRRLNDVHHTFGLELSSGRRISFVVFFLLLIEQEATHGHGFKKKKARIDDRLAHD